MIAETERDERVPGDGPSVGDPSVGDHRSVCFALRGKMEVSH